MASDHPVFTRAYEVIAALGERTGLGDLRRRVLAEARGRVLIVGLGPGHDLDHLPDAVTSVVAIEPSASMRESARTRVHAGASRGIDIDVVHPDAGSADADEPGGGGEDLAGDLGFGPDEDGMDVAHQGEELLGRGAVGLDDLVARLGAQQRDPRGADLVGDEHLFHGKIRPK